MKRKVSTLTVIQRVLLAEKRQTGVLHENGLGAVWVNNELKPGVPVIAIECGGTR